MRALADLFYSDESIDGLAHMKSKAGRQAGRQAGGRDLGWKLGVP